jgi:hypothetical protein
MSMPQQKSTIRTKKQEWHTFTQRQSGLQWDLPVRELQLWQQAIRRTDAGYQTIRFPQRLLHSASGRLVKRDPWTAPYHI